MVADAKRAIFWWPQWAAWANTGRAVMTEQRLFLLLLQRRQLLFRNAIYDYTNVSTCFVPDGYCFMLQTGKMYNINLLAILLLRYVAQTWHIRTGCRYRRWAAFIKYPLWCWFLQYLFFSLVASSTWSRIMLWIFIYRIVGICYHTPFVESYALVKVSRSSALCWCDMLIPLFFFIQFPAVSFVSLKAKQLWRFKSRLISMH